MNDNYNYTEYNDEKNQIPWKKIFLTLLSLTIIFILVFFTLRMCSKNNLNDKLLKVGKNYYEKNSNELPSQIGECKKINVKELNDKKIINNTKDYNTCDLEKTYVNVCYLESKDYHYNAVLECSNDKTKYTMWKDGKNEDLIKDKSDVRFQFIAQELKLGTKHYYPSDKTQKEEIKEYYTTSPKEEYLNKEDETIGYKWYMTTNENNYYESGKYASIQPNNFPNKGESKVVTNYTITKPQTASYRTISDTTLYRSQKVAKPFLYFCSSKTQPHQMSGPTPCALRDDSYTVFVNMNYTCNSKDEVKKDTICTDFTSWSEDKCTSSTLNGIKCEQSQGYIYNDTMWKWYKTTKVNRYYPSKNTDATKENTYYVESPTIGAIKDETTKASVAKYYKLTPDETNSNYEEWVNINNDYLDEKQLIEEFNKLKYDVKSLSDINKINTIRYQFKLQYRNIEE
ncbi:MAG: hypothetical protein RSB71_00470 [Bacilli bacterium]